MSAFGYAPGPVPKPAPARKRRGPTEPVSRAEAEAIFARDRGCVAALYLGAPGPCSGRLTIDHVKLDGPCMARRGRGKIAVCYGHHLGGWITTKDARQACRDYLARRALEASSASALGQMAYCRRVTARSNLTEPADGPSRRGARRERRLPASLATLAPVGEELS